MPVNSEVDTAERPQSGSDTEGLPINELFYSMQERANSQVFHQFSFAQAAVISVAGFVIRITHPGNPHTHG